MDPSEAHALAGGATSTTAPPKPPGSDVKPRLTKDQHDILEQHFLAQHKPSTNVKKEFATRLGVPLDKINASDPVIATCPPVANRACRTGSRTDEPKSSRTVRSS
jgi:hypothetical protein